jgi:hypothetical protein
MIRQHDASTNTHRRCFQTKQLDRPETNGDASIPAFGSSFIPSAAPAMS